MTMIQDKINRINKSVLDKKMTIQKRNSEIEDLELQLKNQRDEVDQVLADKNASLNEVLDDIQKLNEREINYVVSMNEF
jgi:ABC-type transporter Mla subunit MlaD